MNIDRLPSQYSRIAQLLSPYQAYLVGGAVRDLLLDNPIHDLDFTLPGDAVPAARLVADEFGGGFYLLDQERGAARVILGGSGHPRLTVDFTHFQGTNIEEDLAARDFTITSMAIPVGASLEVIDPWGGRQDLKKGVVRSTSPGALADDPLRCLRAIRLAAQHQFRILPDTIAQIRQNRSQLLKISPERIRDELFRILSGPHQAGAIISLQKLDLLSYFLAGDLTEERIRTLRNLETIWGLFLNPHDQDRAGDWFSGNLVQRLGRYRTQFQAYLAEEPVPGRSIYQLTFLLPLIGSGEEAGSAELVRDRLERLALSNQEISLAQRGLEGQRLFLSRSSSQVPLGPLDVYFYYQAAGRAGRAAIMTGLASVFGEQGPRREQWIPRLDAARFLLEGYWEHQGEWVDPPRLLDGDDLLRELALDPGPQIGQLLEALREEQVRAGLDTPALALAFLRAKLDQEEGARS